MIEDRYKTLLDDCRVSKIHKRNLELKWRQAENLKEEYSNFLRYTRIFWRTSIILLGLILFLDLINRGKIENKAIANVTTYLMPIFIVLLIFTTSVTVCHFLNYMYYQARYQKDIVKINNLIDNITSNFQPDYSKDFTDIIKFLHKLIPKRSAKNFQDLSRIIKVLSKKVLTEQTVNDEELCKIILTLKDQVKSIEDYPARHEDFAEIIGLLYELIPKETVREYRGLNEIISELSKAVNDSGAVSDKELKEVVSLLKNEIGIGRRNTYPASLLHRVAAENAGRFRNQ